MRSIDQDRKMRTRAGPVPDFSEPREARAALEEAYAIIHRSPAVVFLWRNEEDWPVEFVSKNVTRVLGWDSESFLSGRLHYASLIHPDDLARVRQEVVGHGGEPRRDEFEHRPYRVRTPDGTYRWVDDRTAVRRDEQGRITHYQGIVLDITDEVAARSRLGETLQELRERNKELRCLYRMTRILDQEAIGLQEVLVETVKLIPPAWQRPQATFARIRYKEHTATTRPFEETPWQQESPIRVRGEEEGRVEVFAHPSSPWSVEGPFLDEEQRLLDAVADQLARSIERMQAEKVLRDHEAHYRNLVENLGEVIFTMDRDGVLTYVSPIIHRVIGYEDGEVLGKPFTGLIPRDDLAERRARFRKVLAGEPSVSEFRLKTRGGDERWVRASTRPLVKRQKIVGVQGVLMDITDLKDAWKELMESRERLETILVSLPVGVVIIDRDTKTIVEANPAALSLIGAPEEQVVGRVCHQYICPFEEGHCPIKDLSSGLDNSERTLLDAEGRAVPIQKSVIPMELDHRTFLIECFSDIRAQKQAQEEREARERLRAAVETAGAVCHELNQPLQALVGYADLLSLEVASESAIRRHADMIRQQVRAMSAITKKLERIHSYTTKGYLGQSRIIDIDRASGSKGDRPGAPDRC